MSEVNPNLPVAPPLAVSPGEAARLLGVSRRTLTRLIQQDKVKAKKLGRRTLIDAQGLRRFFEGLPEIDGQAPLFDCAGVPGDGT